MPTLDVPAGDPREDEMDAFTQLGDPMHPIFGHPKSLARGFNHMYHKAQIIRHLPTRTGTTDATSHAVYLDEYTQIVN